MVNPYHHEGPGKRLAACAAGSGVDSYFLVARLHRLGRQHLPQRPVAEGLLDAPILQRMKTDQHRPSARLEAPGQLLHQPIQGLQFVIDGDPQRLENAGRRVDAPSSGSLGARHTAPHEVGQLLGRLQWLRSPQLDDAPSDAPAETLLAVVENQVGEVSFREAPQQVAGRFALGRVHAHVQGSRLAEAEAPLRRFDLIGAEAQIGQNTIDGRNSQLCQHLASWAKLAWTRVTGRSDNAGRARASMVGSQSRPMSRPAGPRR